MSRRGRKEYNPSSWKQIFLWNTNTAQVLSLEPSIHIGNIKKTVTIIKSKELYNNLIMDKIKPPTSIECWVNLYIHSLKNMTGRKFIQILLNTQENHTFRVSNIKLSTEFLTQMKD